jgi:propanediol dehydratase large subunit
MRLELRCTTAKTENGETELQATLVDAAGVPAGVASGIKVVGPLPETLSVSIEIPDPASSSAASDETATKKPAAKA